MNINKTILIIIVLFLPSKNVWAGLSFETKEIIYHADFADKKFQARFSFKNPGQYPITITDTRTSCGCTTVSLDGETIVPGASGVLEATFTFGSRKGRQIKEIIVETDDPKDRSVHLSLIAYIPEIIQIKPAFVYWTMDSLPDSKTLGIEVLYARPLKVMNVQSSSETLKTELKIIEEGKSFQILVTPQHTKVKLNARITFDLVNPEGLSRSFNAYARILPARRRSRRLR